MSDTEINQLWRHLLKEKIHKDKERRANAMFQGSAAVCINEHNEILMVLQGAEGEELKWSVPSGRKKTGESFKDCCVRETFEETGYIVEIEKELPEKNTIITNIQVKVKYFKATVTGGERCIQDPDELIYDIQWISKEHLKDLILSFPEDREFLLELMR